MCVVLAGSRIRWAVPCIVSTAGGQEEKEVRIKRVTLYQIRPSWGPSRRSSRRLSYAAREIFFPPSTDHTWVARHLAGTWVSQKYPWGHAVTPCCLRTPQKVSLDSQLLEIPMQLQVILNVTGFRPILRGALKREGVGSSRGRDTAEFSLFRILLTVSGSCFTSATI